MRIESSYSSDADPVVEARPPTIVGRSESPAGVVVHPLGDTSYQLSAPRWTFTPEEAERLGRALIAAAERARTMPPVDEREDRPRRR